MFQILDTHLEVVSGSDSKAAEGLALQWTSQRFPNLAGATLAMTVGHASYNLYGNLPVTWTGSVPATPANPTTISLDVSAAQTGALGADEYDYQLQATLTNGDSLTLAIGKLSVEAPVPNLMQALVSSPVQVTQTQAPAPASSLAMMALQPSGDITGVTDTTNIQQALDLITASRYPNQGGAVILGSGVFFINKTLQVPVDNVTLMGLGCGTPNGNKNTNGNPQYGGTVLQATTTFTGTSLVSFAMTTPTRTLSGCYLKDIGLDAFFTTGSVNGVFWQAQRGGIQNVYVFRPSGHGYVHDGNSSVTFPNDSYDNHHFNARVDNPGGHGFVYQNDSTDNTSVECTAFGAGGHGVYCDPSSSSNRWTGGYFYGCAERAMQFDIAMQQKVVGVRAQDCNGLIYMTCTGDGDFEISGCTMRNGSEAGDGLTDGIQISGAGQGGLISGNTFTIDQGLANGSLPTWNRMRYLINITNSGVQRCVIAPYSAGATGSGNLFTAGDLQDLGNNTQIVGAVGQSGLPEIKHSGGLRILWHAGNPNGVVFANAGSLCFNTLGGASQTMWVNENGGSAWTAK